jgi:universal stress protein E
MPDHRSAAVRCVLAASNLLPGSGRAIVAAAALAEAYGAELHVVHCVASTLFAPMRTDRSDEILEHTKDDLHRQIRRVAGQHTATASFQVRSGDVPLEISAAASETGANLIVLGPEKPGSVVDELRGSTAERVIRQAGLPCMIANGPISLPLRRVLVATDLSAPAKYALEVGIELLEGAFSHADQGTAATIVELLHVSAFALPYQPVVPQDALNELAERARARWRKTTAVDFVPRIVSAPTPAEGIHAEAAATGADIVLMGTHGHGPLGRTLFGSVASAVLRTVACPVLLLRTPDD